MKNLTKKVVILKNFASPYVSQAIIVLRDYNPKLEGKAVSDAELIVSRYIERLDKKGQPSKAVRKRTKLFKFFLAVLVLAVFCLFAYHLGKIN